MKFYNKTSESPLSHIDNTSFNRFIRRMNILLYGGYYLICAALVLVGLLGLISQLSNKIRCTELVQGKVATVKTIESITNDEDGGTRITESDYPVFSYNFNGCDYSYTASMSNSSLKSGHKLDVYVDPDDPTRVFIPEYKTVWRTDMILFFIGTAMAVGMTIHIKRVNDGARNYYALLNNNNE